MSQEFFVNSIKELLTGKLGYVSQSIYADARRHKQEAWKEYENATILSKVSACLTLSSIDYPCSISRYSTTPV